MLDKEDSKPLFIFPNHGNEEDRYFTMDNNGFFQYLLLLTLLQIIKYSNILGLIILFNQQR